MDINKLLSGVNCSCGKVHTCDIKYVYIEKNATKRLKEICRDNHNLLIVADQNTYDAAGEKTVAALSDKHIKKVIFSGEEILVPNETTIAEVTDNLVDVDLIIGIGSGVIQDLCKYVSFYNNVPYIVVATAPSMDGYASNGAAMITGGMKVTYPAGLPQAIIADTEVLANAPIDMIKAGYGDIIGKFSALNDWKLSCCVNDEYFCDYIYNLTYEQIKRTLDLSNGIIKRDEESIKTLMEALIVVGILMSFAGSSRPASGSEHHLSHFFEITGIITNSNYFPHGIDVAYSTVITAEIREKILANKFPQKIYRPQKQQYEKIMKEIYKEVADGCIELQNKVGNYVRDRTTVYSEKEMEIREILSEMPSAKEIEKMLSLVNLDIKEFYDLYGEEKINNAILYAKDLKDRYTVLWMNYDFLEMKRMYENIKVIAMDLDGTLTQHKTPISAEHRTVLKELSKKYKLLMVGAGQVERIFKQLEAFPIDIIGNYGMQYGVYNAETKNIDILRNVNVDCDKQQITEKINALREKYRYTEYSGETVEFHPSGCVTFPILGTKAKQEDKLSFDPDRSKRRKIYNDVVNTFGNYCVFVGGSSSFDMAPKPYDKYYALDVYCRENGIDHSQVVYIGDDYGLGGNDESVYKSDFHYITIDNYLDFSKKVEPLL